jgi:uncharacterized coiled-coil protein SlyX
MDKTEFRERLDRLGMKQAEFAKVIRIDQMSVYHWKEPPRYVEVVLGLLEKLRAIQGETNVDSKGCPSTDAAGCDDNG